MVPHAAMGGNLAIESASTLVNLLLSMRDDAADDDFGEIPLSVLDEGLQNYAGNRQARAENVVNHAQTVCRDQLCLNGNYREKVLGLNDADWLRVNLAAFSGSEKMRTEMPDKARVRFYTERAQRIQELLRKGKLPPSDGFESRLRSEAQ